MRAAADVMKAVEGCLDASVWEARESAALVSTATFESEEARTQPVAMSAGTTWA